MVKKKKEKFKPTIWLYIALFAFPLVLTLLYVKSLDNDIWYLLSEGRYIVTHGIYHIDPLSMHEGLQVVVQNWLSASIFWIIYDLFGEMGLLFLILICNFFICFMLYKICNLISDKNYVLSLLIMFLCDITLTSHYIVSRPQIFSFILLLGVIYVLELYAKTEDKKYLIWLPILSLIEANLHASLWWMIFLFTLPYVIDSFKIKFLNTQGFKKKPLFIAILLAFLVGFINPYGYKMITFIFTSYGDKYMHLYINELLPYSFSNNLGKHMFITFGMIAFCYAFFREGHIRFRYLCLFAGTLLLGFMSVKGFSHFILVSFFPMAYFFKDIFPKDFSELDNKSRAFIKGMLMLVSGICFAAFIFLLTKAPAKVELKHDAQDVMTYMIKKFDPNDVTIYSSFNNGGFVEFYGYKPYIDPRAELYLKKNNKKDDIFEELYKLQHRELDVESFISKYNFTHLLVQNSDVLYNNSYVQDKYFIIYENTKTGYRLYMRDDLLTDEERKEAEKQYTDAVDKAKEEAEKKDK